MAAKDNRVDMGRRMNDSRNRKGFTSLRNTPS